MHHDNTITRAKMISEAWPEMANFALVSSQREILGHPLAKDKVGSGKWLSFLDPPEPFSHRVRISGPTQIAGTVLRGWNIYGIK